MNNYDYRITAVPDFFCLIPFSKMADELFHAILAMRETLLIVDDEGDEGKTEKKKKSRRRRSRRRKRSRWSGSCWRRRRGSRRSRWRFCGKEEEIESCSLLDNLIFNKVQPLEDNSSWRLVG